MTNAVTYLAGIVLAIPLLSFIKRQLTLRRITVHSAFVEADFLLTKGLEAFHARKFTLARERYERSIALYPRHRNHLTCAKGYHQIGNVYFEKGKYDRAIRWHRKSVAFCQNHGLQQMEASSWYWLGAIHQHRFALPQAFDAYERSLTLARKTGDRKDLANALASMGVVRMYEGDFTESVRYIREAIEVERRPPANTVGIFQCFSYLLMPQIFMTNFAAAEQTLSEMTVTAEALGGGQYAAELDRAKDFLRHARESGSPLALFKQMQDAMRNSRSKLMRALRKPPE